MSVSYKGLDEICRIQAHQVEKLTKQLAEALARAERAEAALEQRIGTAQVGAESTLVFGASGPTPNLGSSRG